MSEAQIIFCVYTFSHCFLYLLAWQNIWSFITEISHQFICFFYYHYFDCLRLIPLSFSRITLVSLSFISLIAFGYLPKRQSFHSFTCPLPIGSSHVPWTALQGPWKCKLIHLVNLICCNHAFYFCILPIPYAPTLRSHFLFPVSFSKFTSPCVFAHWVGWHTFCLW